MPGIELKFIKFLEELGTEEGSTQIYEINERIIIEHTLDL